MRATAAKGSDVRLFCSTAHPSGMSAALVWAGALIRPLATAMLPVMIVTLVAALEGLSLLPFLLVGFPGAIAAATLWTRYRLTLTLAEIHVRGGEAAVRTVTDVLRHGRLAWRPVFDLRKTRTTFIVAFGRTQYELDDADWPDVRVLLDALQKARRAGAVFSLPDGY
ncbi:MAG: hypothetical protein ACR2GR_01365 [Rhodothermales bacterium]